MSKPRLQYAAVFAAKKPLIAELIERYIVEMEAIRPVGDSQRYGMRHVARQPVGQVGAFDLTHHHIIAHAKSRIASGVMPPTVGHDLSNLSVVLKYGAAAWSDCDGLTDAPVLAAKPFLIKHGYLGKSQPRDRRPTSEELERLVDYFNTPARRGKQRVIPMALLTVWQVVSGRRISETCRLLWEDWNRDDHTILVRRMKDPRTRKKNKVVALTEEAQRMLEILWEGRDPNEPRIFPYYSKSVSAAYTLAKKRTGINGLRLHDSRRECSSRLAERGYSAAEAILFTGHDSTKEYERTYRRLRPEDAALLGPIALRVAAPTVPAIQ